jgi:hypothetical protein
MSEPYPDQRPKVQLPSDLELPFFDPERPGRPRVIVKLDRTQPTDAPGALRGLAAWEDVDSNCACE